MDNKIIGRFIPVGKYNDWAKPFFVLTKEPSDYLAPAWKGIMPNGEEYHVIEGAWKFEPIEWHGEGLPPVGIEAEVSVDGGRTWCLYKATSERNGMRLVEIGNFTEEFQSNNWTFRPIRSEADKKKEAVEKAIADALLKDGDFDHEEALRLSTFVYGAISRNEIPHIRID
ncbi:hypothetical protein [Enterobacter roggenkampii]|uniref:hypothetical protein n=1 Tax=Enterobacter roggenkampii TaxID=1812935 RepID=UPI00292801B2|nr:hypothetical protein [Enterobacter roggenkampii]MDV0393185.1 hypothetical protein [Enterobacter roggenkampii]